MLTPYDLVLSRIHSFYDLDNRTPIGTKSNVYILERSLRDYDFIKTLFKPEQAAHNISKMKQISSLFDFIHHVENDGSQNKNSRLRIEIRHVSPTDQRGLVQVSFGDVFYFSLTKESINPEDPLFASRISLKDDLFIKSDEFEKIYVELLETLPKFVDKDLTLQEFNDRTKKTFNTIRIENLKNTELTYCSSSECSNHFDVVADPKVFFNSLTKVFSHKLIQQVKTIESLLRFEAFLKYNRTVYHFDFYNELTAYKFRLPINLYAVVFEYENNLDVNIKLYFNYKSNIIRYIEIDYKTNDKIDISGYEEIYEYLFNRIKTRLTSGLGVPVDEISNRSVLLYKMINI